MHLATSFTTVTTVSDGSNQGVPFNQQQCPVVMNIYPSQDFHDNYRSTTPFVMTFTVLSIFCFSVFMFILYDCLVERRQQIVFRRAAKTTSVVKSLFPENIANQIIEAENSDIMQSKFSSFLPGNRRLQNFLTKPRNEFEESNNPIADLFPHCTVLFADITDFTAWSSSRDPSHVFLLLQKIYRSLDLIAKRRSVFKVETVGDAYVAVTGLPEPQGNHFLIMARFASECLAKMNQVAYEMESSLGPDTAELSMR